MSLQISTPYTEPIPSNSPPLDLKTLMPSGKYIKTYCEQQNCPNFHAWNSHRQLAFCTVILVNALRDYDRLSLQAGLLVYATESVLWGNTGCNKCSWRLFWKV